ncbi:MAG: substrate-binding domain-containing protein [Terriglobia bacterium]
MRSKPFQPLSLFPDKPLKKARFSRREFVGGGMALASALMVEAGCQSIPSRQDSLTNAGKSTATSIPSSLVFYFVTHGSNADTFWGAQNNGWLDFCRAYQIDGRYIGTKLDGDVGEMRANLDSVLAAGGGDGLAVVISNASMLDAPIRQAIAKGTPVIAVNVPDFRPESQRIPYLRYVGGAPWQTGAANAKMALKIFQQRVGRPPKRAVYLIHAPGVEVLEIRGQGMEKTLRDEGTAFEKLAVPFDPTQTREAVRAYMRAHPDLETVHTGSSRVAAWAVQELKELGKLGNSKVPQQEGQVYVAAIDLDTELLGMIVAGECLGTIDEQPYMQGWYGAQLLYHWVKYRFLPGQDLSTGPFTVDDPKTAGLLIEYAKKGLRA